MKLRPIGSNQTVLTFGNGDQILFSYQQPVAAKITDASGEARYYRTNQYFSVTTTRHIHGWFDRRGISLSETVVVDQTEINSIIPMEVSLA